MKELVERIVRALVDFPEEISIREIEGVDTRILEIKVVKQDIGKLIGKKGKNITALRTLVSAAGKGKRYLVEVVEENRHPPADSPLRRPSTRDTDGALDGEESGHQERADGDD